MDIVSRKAILRQLLAEARANKERAEQDADRVRLRVAEKVPVYADMSGAISRIAFPQNLCSAGSASTLSFVIRTHFGSVSSKSFLICSTTGFS